MEEGRQLAAGLPPERVGPGLLEAVVGDGSNMFGDVFAAFPKHLLTGDQQIQINMAQTWLSDPTKNYGLVISAVNEGQTGTERPVRPVLRRRGSQD